MRLRGFTLIELLIVVGIIAILAAIAVPNFLLAQIRAKVSRARSDMRTLATAVETYRVDTNRYPPNVEFQDAMYAPDSLTTPISYLTSLPVDPFKTGRQDDRLRRLEYHNVKEQVDKQASGWPPNDLVRYGDWRLVSWGPGQAHQPWLPYDPTNGTVSEGNVLRTQRSPEGKILFTFWDPNNPEV